MKTDLFDYLLPVDRIAQEPRPRGASRLLVLDRKTGAISHRNFADFPSLLSAGDVLVRNDVAVRNARLWGRDEKGRLVEIFLLAPLGSDQTRWSALAKPGRRAKRDRTISLPGGASARIGGVHPDGRREAEFDRPIDDRYLETHGAVPLPPYIRRKPGAPDRPEDRAGYQTVFAREPLAVAAPTAGLHFTEESFEAIRARGAAVADLTLAVGAGTFKPVTAAEIEEHAMEAEQVSIPPETLRAIDAARSRGGRVVAAGTTVTRSLEAAARLPAASGSPRRFATNLFIAPGFDFRGIDALLTNFHLPRSTLLMLVCAFAGRERVLAAYEEAIRKDYLFYSFGDAMFIA
ncbi:MAG: tRNA preQ1(34) S-adenosylmethionine ribosyltransferase-isomerase QueA [Acidobacteriota bacterium]|nr:tRNA preQ1(34) S-adenosylmethionine ribosyltransferase-isomerase QueA [Acidobacteriota bacterium]